MVGTDRRAPIRSLVQTHHRRLSTQGGTNKTRTSKNPILDTKEEDKEEEDTEEEKKKFTDALHEHTESTKRSDLIS